MESHGRRFREGHGCRGSSGDRLRLRNPGDWSAEVIDFLTVTITSSASKLAEHPFLKIPPQVNELVPPVTFSLVSASRFYSLRNSYMRLRSVA